MKRQVDVLLNPATAASFPVTVTVRYLAAACRFDPGAPDKLAQWLAYLLKEKQRQPTEPAPSEWLNLGRCGDNDVCFEGDARGMMFSLGKPYEKNDDSTEEGSILFIPGDLMDDLADGVARAHRIWVEHSNSIKNPEAQGPCVMDADCQADVGLCWVAAAEHPLLSIVYENAVFNIRVPGPEMLARWAAHLHEHSEMFEEPDEPDLFNVGRCGNCVVVFGIASDSMILLARPKSNEVYPSQGFSLNIPRQQMDQLAASLTAARDQWLKKPA